MNVNRAGGRLERAMTKGYQVVRKSEVKPEESLCGESWRMLTRQQTDKMSLHLVRIREARRQPP